MFEKFNELAETAATGASRRQFFGKLGRGAMLAAVGLSGLLAFPYTAYAARGGKTCSPNIEGPCQGKKAGSKCAGGEGDGTCHAYERLDDGYYACTCRAPKQGGGNKDKA